MPSDTEEKLNAIRAYIDEAKELCELEVLTARNQGTPFRLPELSSATLILRNYAKIAEGIADDADPLLVRFVWERMGGPLHELAARLKTYRETSNPTPELRNALSTHALGCFAEVYYSLALAQASIEADAIGEIPEARKKMAHLASEVDSIEREARAALKTAQDAARESGLSANLEAFANAAKEHASSAKAWALAAVGCAVMLLIGGCLQDGPKNTDAWNTAQNLFFFGERIFLASVVSFLMVTCVRNYRAARHNEVLNEHRKRSLQTFERLRAGAIADNVKDAILVQATDAIFSMQVSGFADGAIGVTHAHQLLELVKPKD
jgi:hypothetical protein